MAVKTITIDLEAYELLARHKKLGQSFSQVIKEHFGRVRTGQDLKEALALTPVSPELVDSLDAVVASRGSDQARLTEL